MSQLDRLINQGYRVTLRSTGFATVMTVSRPSEPLLLADGAGCYTLHITAQTYEEAAEAAWKALGEGVDAPHHA